MRPALRAGEIERGEPSTRQLPEPGNLSGSRQYHDLNRLCLRGSLELSGRHRGLEENHGVRRTSEIRLRYSNVGIVIVITECAEGLLRAFRGRSVTRHYYG